MLSNGQVGNRSSGRQLVRGHTHGAGPLRALQRPRLALIVRVGLLLSAAGVLGMSRPTELANATSARRPSEAKLLIRFLREDVVSCEDSISNIFRRKPSCKTTRRIVEETALLELRPLPDAARDIFGSDSRKPITVELRCDNRAAEKVVTLERGPWLASWQKGGKSLRFDLEQAGRQLTLHTERGACVAHFWRCRLNPSVVSNRMAITESH